MQRQSRLTKQGGKQMKKIYFAAMTAMAASAAHADFQPLENGGFVGGRDNIVTVAQAREMRDDAYVVLQGNIIQRMGDDKYLFEDTTGSITVEIDKKDWNGATVTPNDTVKLYGEVDRGLMSAEIDVDYVQKLDKAAN